MNFLHSALAQSGMSPFGLILQVLFFAALFAIPLYILSALFKFMKSTLSNQQQIIKKLDELNANLREK